MYKKFGKRIIDIILSLIAIIVLSPIYIVISILVLIFMGWPILFKQPRPGKNEKIFNMYKFRTMTNKKDKDGNLLPDEQRLTKFGKFLRKTSLDELPEFINILSGQMSFIGPRPLLIEYLPYYTEEEHHRHDVRPGLTGWAQVNGRNSLNWNDRFKKDLEYIDQISFALDCKILFLTVIKVLIKADIQMGNELLFKRLDLEREISTKIKKIYSNDFYIHKNELYNCIKQLKNNDINESRKILNNMNKYLNDGTAIIYAALVGNHVIGFVWGYHIYARIIHINYFVVLSRFRGHGIGAELLSKFITDYINSPFELLVHRDNYRAIKFYNKHGFKKKKFDDKKYKMVLR